MRFEGLKVKGKRIFSVCISMALIAGMAVLPAGCGKTQNDDTTFAVSASPEQEETTVFAEIGEVGEKGEENAAVGGDAADQINDSILLSKAREAELGEEMVKLVNRIISAVAASKEEVDLSDVENAYVIKNAIQIAAYLDPLTEISRLEEKKDENGVFAIDYGCSAEEHKALVEAFDHKIDEIETFCKKNETTKEEYAKEVFAYLVKNNVYEYDTFLSSREHGITADEAVARYNVMSTYNVIVNGHGVCQQLTKAYSFLLRRNGIEAAEVGGLSNEMFQSNNSVYASKTVGELFGSSHMWNVICIDEKWYGVDVTFANTYLEGNGASEDNIYRYFGMGREINEMHFPSDAKVLTPGYGSMEMKISEEPLLSAEVYEGRSEDTNDFFEDDLKVKLLPAEYDYLEDVLEFHTLGHQYKITAFFPETEISEGCNVCYVLGGEQVISEMQDELEKADFSEENAVIISVEPLFDEESLLRDAAIVYSELTGGIVNAVEEKYEISVERRGFAGADGMANLVLFAFTESDVNASFTDYICISPDLLRNASGYQIGTFEAAFFSRTKEAEASLSIYASDEMSGSLKARTDLFADYIKKREYKKLNFVYETK